MSDVIKLGSTSHDYTTAFAVDHGTGPDTIDGDFDTYWGNFFRQSGGGSGSGSIISLHVFSTPYDLTHIHFKAYIATGTNAGGDSNVGSATVYVEVYREGGWEQVAGTYKTVACGGECSKADSVDFDDDVNLTGVSEIRAVGNVYAAQSGSGGGQWANSHLFEIQAEALVAGGYICIV